MRTNLVGKRILVTGAARGVGAETAAILAQRGARLALLDVNLDQLIESVAAESPETICLQADVRDRQQVREAVGSALERFEGLDVVVANAGVIQPQPVQHITREAFETTLDVNVLGVWHAFRESLPAVLASGGYILLVSSLIAAYLPHTATYNASTAAVEAFANAMRTELKIADSGVDLGIAYSSIIDIDLEQDAERSSKEFFLSEISDEPVLKLLKPERVAKAVVRGIERRSRTIVVPWYYWPVQMAPGFAQRFVESHLARRTALSRVRI